MQFRRIDLVSIGPTKLTFGRFLDWGPCTYYIFTFGGPERPPPPCNIVIIWAYPTTKYCPTPTLPRSYDEDGRRRRKREKRERWYRREPRGTSIRELESSFMIVPPTPEGILVKELRKACKEELKGTKISIRVQERGGRQL